MTKATLLKKKKKEHLTGFLIITLDGEEHGERQQGSGAESLTS